MFGWRLTIDQVVGWAIEFTRGFKTALDRGAPVCFILAWISWKIVLISRRWFNRIPLLLLPIDIFDIIVVGLTILFGEATNNILRRTHCQWTRRFTEFKDAVHVASAVVSNLYGCSWSCSTLMMLKRWLNAFSIKFHMPQARFSSLLRFNRWLIAKLSRNLWTQFLAIVLLGGSFWNTPFLTKFILTVCL